MAALKASVATATIMLMIQLAMATDFTVGSPGGSWDLTTNFATWAKAKTFVVGDNLIFTYPPTQHDVVEVTKANYDSCSTSGAIKTYTTGNDTIPLPAATTRYFICGFAGHCQAGMKVTINVIAAAIATPPPSTSTPAPTPTPPTVSPPPSHSAPAPSTKSPPPSHSAPAPTPPTVSPPPSHSTPPPTSPSGSPPPSGSSTPPPSPSTPSGSNGHNLQAKAAVGFGIGMLIFLAL